MKTTCISYVIYAPTQGYVEKSSPLRFTDDFSVAKIYQKKGLAKQSIAVHNKRLKDAVIIDVHVSLDPENLFVHMLLADAPLKTLK